MTESSVPLSHGFRGSVRAGREAGMEGEGWGRGEGGGGGDSGGKHLPRLKSPGKSVCGLR